MSERASQFPKRQKQKLNLRRGFSFWHFVISLGLLILAALILFPVFGRVRENRHGSCQSNLKEIMLGMTMYVVDYDRGYPLATSSRPNFGWGNLLQPYLKTTSLYQCPSEPNGWRTQIPPMQREYTDYWYNARLSGVSQSALSDCSSTLSLGDGNDGTDLTNARYYLLSIPQKWRDDTASPLYRHLGGANFAFADGHVKFLKADAWHNELDAQGATFRLTPPTKSVHSSNPRLRPTH